MPMESSLVAMIKTTYIFSGVLGVPTESVLVCFVTLWCACQHLQLPHHHRVSFQSSSFSNEVKKQLYLQVAKKNTTYLRLKSFRGPIAHAKIIGRFVWSGWAQKKKQHCCGVSSAFSPMYNCTLSLLAMSLLILVVTNYFVILFVFQITSLVL